MIPLSEDKGNKMRAPLPMLVLLACAAAPAQPRAVYADSGRKCCEGHMHMLRRDGQPAGRLCFLARTSMRAHDAMPMGTAVFFSSRTPPLVPTTPFLRQAPPLCRLQASAASNVGSAKGGVSGERQLSPLERLEQMRAQKQSVGWGERFAASFAPRSSPEEFKLNWVGNIDRHQRQVRFLG